ncbi:MAG: histidine kinase [Roseiflexaceae bacterium]
MNRPFVSTPSAMAPDRPEPAGTRLRGRRLLLARAAWLAVAAAALGLFTAGVPAEFAQLQVVCPSGGNCPPQDGIGQLSPDGLRALHDLGLSLSFFAAYGVALDVALAAVYSAVAALIFWRRSADRFALFTALALLTFGTATFPATMYSALVAAHPAWWPLVAILNFLGLATFSLFLYLFPDGRFVPRWTRWVALAWIAWLVPKYWIPTWPDVSTWTTWINTVVWLGALGTVVYAQVYRYRHVSTSVQRQQTKWVVFGIAAALMGFLSITLTLAVVAPAPDSAGALLTILVGVTITYLCMLLIPLAIGAAILRYRLFDIDIIINRTLVYGALTASVVGIYVLVVGALGALVQARGSLLISLLATGVVAMLFQPLREYLQRAANRLLYGERDNPYAVLARLGQRLEATLAPDAVLPAIVQTVAEALKLPYAALALNGPAGLTVVAVHGTPAATPLHLPLSYQNEPIGELRLAPRAAGEAFSPADRRLLADLARQAGVAAYAMRITADLRRVNADLQRSRARLVTTREEERRRLRRDLHDGLGPALAAQTLKVGTAKYLVSRDPSAAEALLTELEADIGAALAEIRQVVYNLRPAALDELGLVGAIRASAGQYYPQWANAGGGDDIGGLRVVVEAPERLAPLPAAVEVAAYRIVHEALANVVRHAHAQTCQIQLALVEQGEQLLCLDIMDDGCGLPRERHQGVGLATMRERAAELGGTCVVAPGPSGGTWVRARLPLPPPPELVDQEHIAA